MREIVIPVPSIAAHQRISTCLESLDNLIAAQSEKLEALRAHRRDLMQWRFPSME